MRDGEKDGQVSNGDERVKKGGNSRQLNIFAKTTQKTTSKDGEEVKEKENENNTEGFEYFFHNFIVID